MLSSSTYKNMLFCGISKKNILTASPFKDSVVVNKHIYCSNFAISYVRQ